jgi:hypothetical protein
LPSTPLWQPGSFAERQSVWLIEAARLAAAGDEAAFRCVQVADWRDSRQPPTRPHARWLPALCGGRVLECDLQTAAGLAAARVAVAARRPIVMRNAARRLVPMTAELSSMEGLRRHLRGVDVTVLKAPRAVDGIFTYYFDAKAAKQHGVMAPPPVNQRLIMRWEEFVARLGEAKRRRAAPEAAGDGGSAGVAGDEFTYYMQLALASRTGGIGAGSHAGVSTRVSEHILKSLQASLRDGPMAELAASLGPWTVTNLYVGPAGTLAPCHWDAMDNIFMQLEGHKDILLFAIDAAGLRAFPSEHPYDSRSRVDLERPDAAARAALDGEVHPPATAPPRLAS